jgi:hypothetical protein
MSRNFTWRGNGIDVDAQTVSAMPRAFTTTKLAWNRVRTSWDRAFPR